MIRNKLGILLCVVLLVMPVSALSVDIGETWVSWEWNLDIGQKADVYVNGELVSENGTMKSYVLTGMEPNERAHIVVYNASSEEILESHYATTTAPIYVNILLFAIIIVLAIVSYGTSFEMGLAVGGFNVLLGIALLNISIGISMMPYLAMGGLILQVAIMAIIIYEQISDVLGWF